MQPELTDNRPTSTRGDDLCVTDLLLTLPEVTGAIGARIAAPDALDGFLLAAAAVQILEDHLESEVLGLRRAAAVAAGRTRAALTRIADHTERGRRALPGARRTAKLLRPARALRDQLADHLVRYETPDPALAEPAARLHAAAGRLPAAVRRSPLRLPACFRSFDLAPVDAIRLADKLAASWAARPRTALIVGVRTSGSYLAPLVAATLRRRGFNATAVCLRPSRSTASEIRARLRAADEVAIVDDPPVTGSAYRQTLQFVHEHRTPGAPTTLLVPLFGDRPPQALLGMRMINLPYAEWAVQERLTPAALAHTLESIWGEPVQVTARSDGPPRATGRTNVRARYRVSSARGVEEIEVCGAGQGLFGRHALAIAYRMGDALCPVHGFRDGLLFTSARPESSAPLTSADVGARVDYVATRARELRAAYDRARDMGGRQPAWELAARHLARGYGRLGHLLRLPLIDPAVRLLCNPTQPSIVDGATGPTEWYHDKSGRLRKLNAYTHDFGNVDRACYDPVFDLAGLAPGDPDPTVAAAVRPRRDEAFLLYELVHLQDPGTGRPTDPAACTRAVARYLTRHRPPPPIATGPLCALDLDGVIDADALGFPITTPTAQRAVHALIRHRYRPVAVTGRSLPDVVERCAALGLAGGVAEYGSIVHHAGTGETVALVDGPALARLDRVRTALHAMPGVAVDTRYRYSIRASWSPLPTTAPGPLPPEIVEAGLASEDGRQLRVVHGEGQTDIVDTEVNKGTGLAQLGRLLASDVALAVGDSIEDLPMLKLAALALAPGNAAPAVADAGVAVLQRHYAAGLAEATKQLLGHPPGHCPVCREHDHPEPQTRLLCALLDAQSGGRPGLPTAVLKAGIAALAARAADRKRLAELVAAAKRRDSSAGRSSADWNRIADPWELM